VRHKIIKNSLKFVKIQNGAQLATTQPCFLMSKGMRALINLKIMMNNGLRGLDIC